MTKRPIAFALLTVSLIATQIAEPQEHTTQSTLNTPPGFDIPTAMQSLFNNYDLKTATSHYDIPQSTAYNLKGSQFQIGDDILVYPLWVSEAKEDGKNKVVFVFYSVPIKPDGSPDRFECHACTPLIGAAIFVKDGEQWHIESSRTVITSGGSYGDPPSSFRMIHVGPHRIGIEFEDGDEHGGETTNIKILMIPWNGKINEALRTWISDDDSDGCGQDADNFPCYSNHTTMSLIPGKNPKYFDIVLRRSGTGLTDHEPYRAKPVHGYEHLSFSDGFYKTIQQAGTRASINRNR